MNAVVKSFPELHAAVNKYRRDSRWMFRGHANAAWTLVPKAGRSPFLGCSDLGLFRSWKRRAIEFVPRSPETDWDWLAIAQHHGLATRLLDWTINPLVAAFFAVREVYAGPAIIFAHYATSHFTSDKYEDLCPGAIVRFRPTGYAARLTRQGGGFTAHDPPESDLSTALPTGHRLERVEIHEEFRRSLRFELSYFGINDMTLFPDLDGLAAFVNWWTANRTEFDGSEPFPSDDPSAV